MIIRGLIMNNYSITFVPRDGSHIWGYGDYVTGYRNAVACARKYCEDFFAKTGNRIDYYLDKLVF